MKYLNNLVHTTSAVFIFLLIACTNIACSPVKTKAASQKLQTLQPQALQSVTDSSSFTPSPRAQEFDWMSISSWYHRHADQVAIAKQGQAKVLFLGDSITQSWGDGGAKTAAFQQYFSQWDTAIMGIGGDQTQNLLWRLQNGLSGNLHPEAVILLIGVNNFGHSNHSPNEVFLGVQAVVKQIRTNFPEAKLFITGVFPFNQESSSSSRQQVTAVNKQIKHLANNKSVFSSDFGYLYLDNENNIPASLMADFLHPTATGMALYAKELQAILESWQVTKNN